MDRFLVGLTLCACLCLAPVYSAREEVQSAYAQPRRERALFGVLYPELAGLDEEEDVEWYSLIVSWWRGELA